MIGFLAGKLLKQNGSEIILDVNGVGYEVSVPYVQLPDSKQDNSPMTLWIYTRVREDAIKLYGFRTEAEKSTFITLIAINGVGPKVALSILSHLSLGSFKATLEEKSPALLQSVPGIGKRLAEKIILEMAEKCHLIQVPSSRTVPFLTSDAEKQLSKETKTELLQALKQLGYKEKDIKPTFSKLDQSEQNTGTLLKAALGLLKKEPTNALTELF